MVDTVSREKRSQIMKAVRRQSTGAERAVRSALHRMGYRFRLHASELPGSPDIVFRPTKKVVFVHGCFWHGHRNCGRVPKSNVDYWVSKITRNRKRDAAARSKLRRIGWRSLVVWECELKNLPQLKARLERFLTAI
jgi:DNA mismatch endonuclease (patch repair protein)